MSLSTYNAYCEKKKNRNESGNETKYETRKKAIHLLCIYA